MSDRGGLLKTDPDERVFLVRSKLMARCIYGLRYCLRLVPFALSLAISLSADADQCDFTQREKLLGSVGVGQNLGHAVDLDGCIAIVADPGETVNGSFSSGAAYVYRRQSTTGRWDMEQRLTPQTPTNGQLFGFSVSVNNDCIAIAAIGDEPFGAVYTYRFDGTSWTLEQRIAPSVSSFFGTAIDLEEEVLLVTAPREQFDSGAAYVYRFDGVQWNEEQRLTPADIQPNDNFGKSVALSRDLAVVGSPDADLTRGAAYIFRFDGVAWQEETRLSPVGQESQGFGRSVSVDTNVVVVGEPHNRDVFGNDGVVHMFRYDRKSQSWLREQMLRPADAEIDDQFGFSLSLCSAHLLVGQHPSPNNPNGGAGYLFGFDGSIWSERQKLTTFPADNEDGFGTTVALTRESALIGAPMRFSPGPYHGAAFLFEDVSRRFSGRVNAASGTSSDVLFVNGSSGGKDRVFAIDTGEPITLAMSASPAGPAAAEYLLYVWREPSAGSTALGARGQSIGCTVNPTPFESGLSPQPFRCMRSVAIPDRACGDVREQVGPDRAPWAVEVTNGLSVPTNVLLQGVIEDAGADNPLGYSITNAVELRVDVP